MTPRRVHFRALGRSFAACSRAPQASVTDNPDAARTKRAVNSLTIERGSKNGGGK